MEKILNMLGFGNNEKKKKFPKKRKPVTKFPKSNVKTNMNKLPIHIFTNIYSFLDLESEQTEFSSLSKKFRRAFLLLCEEREELELKASLPENILYYLFHILPEFKNLQKLSLYNLTLDKTLLEDFYRSYLEKLKVLKIQNTKIVGTEHNSVEAELKKFCDFIAKCKCVETVNITKFYGDVNRKKLDPTHIPLDFDRMFPEQLVSLRKLTIKECFLNRILSHSFGYTAVELNMFSKLPNLEYLDLSHNNLKFAFILNPNYITFGKSDKIKVINLTNNEIDVDWDFPPYLPPQPTGDQVFSNYELIDVSNNFLNMIPKLDGFKRTFPIWLSKLIMERKKR